MLYLTLFEKPYKLTFDKRERQYRKGNLACVPVNQQLLSLPGVAVLPAAEIFRDYTPGEPCKVFTHLSEGIGDIVAFSAVAKYFEDQGKQITVFVNSRFFDVFDLFECRNIDVRDFWSPVVGNYSFQARLTTSRTMRRLPIEYAITKGGTKNWFEIYFEKCGITDVSPEYLRPRLDTSYLKDLYLLQENPVLLCPKSSTQIRSSSLQDFHIACNTAVPGLQYMAFKRDLNPDEIAYAEQNDIYLEESNFQDFLYWVSIASVVVSTDTAALHIREGLQRPALGVYGAFTTDARTKYYKYTHSFNTASRCEFQPCFKHQRQKVDNCQAYAGQPVAPCQSGTDFVEQLSLEFEKYYQTLNL